MSLPARRQTFALEGCQDVHNKLEWEIDGLKAALGTAEPDELAYRAFNCAVTAWQLTDWVWGDLSPEHKAELGFTKLYEFQGYCREQCRGLHLCRHIATASKHQEVTQHPDPDIEVSMFAEELDASASASTGKPGVTCAWRLSVRDRGVNRDAVAVFEEALSFWDHMIVGQVSRRRLALEHTQTDTQY